MITKLSFLLLLCFSGTTLANYENFTELYDMVLEELEAVSTYTIPTSNSWMLNVTNSTVIELDSYDFVIIGSGSAGAVLANRLTEIRNWTVLTLEAGGNDTAFTDILGLSSAYSYFSTVNWGYNTTTQSNACQGMVDQQCVFPRGRARGGSSSFSESAYTRGNAADYNRWEALGNDGWGWDDVFPYFLKFENAVFPGQDVDLHGIGGYLTIDYTSETPGLEPVITNAFAELGFERGDINGANQTRLDRVQFNLKGNIRASTAHAYLDNFVEYRSNLNLSLNSFVTKVLIDNSTSTAYGVEFVKDGRIYRVNATKEVILSAGCINTPQILMLSGIGPASDLEDLGIDVIQDLPVGENMIDHITYFGFYYRTNTTFWNLTTEELLERWTYNLRPFTAGLAAEMIAFANVNNGSLGRPDMELAMLNSLYASSGLTQVFRLTEDFADVYDNSLKDLWFLPVVLHPESRGTVKLNSSNPEDFPLINPNYFSDDDGYDIETMYKGIQYLLKLNETQAFRDFGATFHNVPVPTCDDTYESLSEDWWTCAIKALSGGLYHPNGTTRMGNSTSDSVVNSSLKVHGMNNLRIVDAGVMPDTISGHINAAVIMIAEKAADIIKEEYL